MSSNLIYVQNVKYDADYGQEGMGILGEKRRNV